VDDESQEPGIEHGDGEVRVDGNADGSASVTPASEPGSIQKDGSAVWMDSPVYAGE
jgi:hypothetical protein